MNGVSAQEGDLSAKKEEEGSTQHYLPPDYFCWDYWCIDEPTMHMDDASLGDYNSRKIALDLIEYLERHASHYRSNNILLTMGMDFHYQIAHVWYKNLDKLIKQFKLMQETEGLKINLLYSTPSCYLKALNDEDLTWPTKQDDFFPYASDWYAY